MHKALLEQKTLDLLLFQLHMIRRYLIHCLESPIHSDNVSTKARAIRKKLTVDDLRSFRLATMADKIFPGKEMKFQGGRNGEFSSDFCM